MRKISKPFMAILFFILINGCGKFCDDSLRIGDIVEIPIQYSGFSISEIDEIVVYRIDNANPSSRDTFLLKEILWANAARSTNEIITDRMPSNADGNYGDYDSYFDNCDLIFDWSTGRDTLSDFEIIKSRENIDGCHENDPNIQIDKLTFIHKENIISKGESIEIWK